MERAVEKAYAYATRTGPDGPMLLVFEHRDHDAGRQVPGGTVEPGETARSTAVRELAEETGTETVELVAIAGEALWHPADGGRPHHRSFVEVAVAEDRDRWTHTVEAGERDAGLVFECFWVPLADLSLDHGMDACLDAVR